MTKSSTVLFSTNIPINSTHNYSCFTRVTLNTPNFTVRVNENTEKYGPFTVHETLGAHTGFQVFKSQFCDQFRQSGSGKIRTFLE